MFTLDSRHFFFFFFLVTWTLSCEKNIGTRLDDEVISFLMYCMTNENQY